MVSSSSPRGPRPFRLVSGAQSALMSSPLGATRDAMSAFGKVIRAEDEMFGSLFQGRAASWNWKRSVTRHHYCGIAAATPRMHSTRLKPSFPSNICQLAAGVRPQLTDRVPRLHLWTGQRPALSERESLIICASTFSRNFCRFGERILISMIASGDRVSTLQQALDGEPGAAHRFRPRPV